MKQLSPHKIIKESNVKRCGRCLNYYEKEFFVKCNQRPNGLHSWCKNCLRIKNRESYLKNRKARIKYAKKYNDEHRENANASSSKWSKNNPKKRIAHSAVGLAIEYGVLIVEPCKICGEKNGVNAHHEDYDRVFDVVWLCSLHHKERHTELNNKKYAVERILTLINKEPKI